MLPFDRFVQGIDDWAAANPGEKIYIQIGQGRYEPRHAPFTRFMPHQEYSERLATCSLFVAHVGMGSILQALELRKQMLLLPRQAALREHTTDHQLHTAEKFRNTPGLKIVDDVPTLQEQMSYLLANPLVGADALPPFAPSDFTDKLAAYFSAT
jgi:UDP-N-acetylglucosamine transferase subunit ALG13